MQHWIVTVNLDNKNYSEDELETLGLEIVSDGALGAYVSGPAEIRFFLKGDMDSAELNARNLLPPNTQFTIAEAPDENWTLKCSEMLAQLTVGEFTIYPLASASAKPVEDPFEDRIYIIPGLGFGTGHHETTKNVLGLLQDPLLQEMAKTVPVLKVLDVGTGSGILAIAAQKLYRGDVFAIDVDADALENAKENASLNELSRAISFAETPLDQCPKGFDLIIANIYAEVLVTMEKSFSERLSTGKFLILSGIMSSKVELITDCFSAKKWKKHQHNDENNWSSFLLERIS